MSTLEDPRTRDCAPAAVVRIGLLGAGNVGSAFARLALAARPTLASRGFAPAVATALVRSAAKPRPATDIGRLATSADEFFAEPHDVIVEALGGVDPARDLVRRALDRGIPVVTANKSLVAAYGDDLSRLARRRATAFRYEAACIAGVPFLGAFGRRPLAASASGVAGILNGTSNYILTAMARGGARYAEALAEAQRLGLAEPNPESDVAGIDAAEKLTILIREFGALLVSPHQIDTQSIELVDTTDLEAAQAFGGVIRPLASAEWSGEIVRAGTGPAFVAATHPFASVAGLSNAVQIRGAHGTLCFTGPGAGPDVTAATLLDDVAEILTDGRLRPPAPVATRPAQRVERPASEWFVRVTGAVRETDAADLLSTYGVWCTRLARHAGRLYGLTCSTGHDRLQAAAAALHAATTHPAVAIPALSQEAAC